MQVRVMSYDLDSPPGPDGQPPTIEHAIDVHDRSAAVRVARAFWLGDGSTAVHDDTMATFTPEERAVIEAQP